MVIEAGRHTIALDLHPRMTVVTGVNELARESLAGELLGALGPSRPGVHLEVVTDDGQQLAVFRPAGGRGRIVDTATGTDISPPDGAPVDLYAQHGIELAQARRSLKVTAADIVTQARADAVVERLAEVDQTRLWAIAARVRVTDEALQAEAAATGTAPEDADIIDQIEQRHHRLEAAVERLNRTRRLAWIVCAIAVLGGIGALAFRPILAVPLIVLAAASLGAAFYYRGQVARAEQAEREALDAAGAESYLGFHLQRINGLVSENQARRRLLNAASDHRAAAADWFDIAGDVSVDWAMEHHTEIAVAARLRDDVRNLSVMSSATSDQHVLATDMAHALVGHLGKARTLGRLGETFPLVIDEPFGDLDPALKAPLLELLSRSAGSPQLILLTDDEEVASWARLEALAGSVSVLEPTPDAQPAPARANGVA